MEILTTPLTPEQANQRLSDGRLTVVVELEFGQIACSSDDATYDGLNDIVEELVITDGFLGDIQYLAVGVRNQDGRNLVQLQISADFDYPE